MSNGRLHGWSELEQWRGSAVKWVQTGVLIRRCPLPYSYEELALMEAIHADPRNDAPRLAYADWLEREGESLHAEFIRLQCQRPYITIATYREKPGLSTTYRFPPADPEADKRLSRILFLHSLLQHSARFAPFRENSYYQEFRRGLGLWEVSSYDANRKGELIRTSPSGRVVVSVPPLVRLRLCLETSVEYLLAWLQSPTLRLVDELRLRVEKDSYAVSDDFYHDLRALNSSTIRTLDTINLAGVPVGIHGILSGKAREVGVIELDE